MKILLIVLICAGLLLIMARLLNANFSKSVAQGLNADGQLFECAKTPNCVSSLTDISEKKVPPFVISKDSDWDFLLAMITRQSGKKPIAQTDHYAHFEFTTPLLGFRDDLELWYDQTHQLAHVRSQSRVGKSDLGANQKRVEFLHSLFAQRQ